MQRSEGSCFLINNALLLNPKFIVSGTENLVLHFFYPYYWQVGLRSQLVFVEHFLF